MSPSLAKTSPTLDDLIARTLGESPGTRSRVLFAIFGGLLLTAIQAIDALDGIHSSAALLMPLTVIGADQWYREARRKKDKREQTESLEETFNRFVKRCEPELSDPDTSSARAEELRSHRAQLADLLFQKDRADMEALIPPPILYGPPAPSKIRNTAVARE